MFWGAILILLGISLILKSVFGINIPIFKVFFAGLLIYWGISLLLGSFGSKVGIEKRATNNEAVFARTQFKADESGSANQEFSTVFGEGELDLTGIDLSKIDTVSVNSVFGESVVFVKKGSAYRVQSNSAFGKSSISQDKNVNFAGKYTFSSPSLKEGEKFLTINANVVFGSFRLEEK